MARIVPLKGTDLARQQVAAAGKIREGEIHSTTDQGRLFLRNTLVGAVWHGSVATEAAMTTLDSTSARGCFPNDHCFRTDLGVVMLCVTNRGGAASDWVQCGGGGGSQPAASSDIRDVWLFG